MENKFEEYIGDGVYASFDGYQIWLAVNHHNNKVVALEPNVFENLLRYRDNLIEQLKRHQEKPKWTN